MKKKEVDVKELIKIAKEKGSIHAVEKELGISHKTIERHIKNHSEETYIDLIKTKSQKKKERREKFENTKRELKNTVDILKTKLEKSFISQEALRRLPTIHLAADRLEENGFEFELERLEKLMNTIFDTIFEKELSPRSNTISAAAICYAYYFKEKGKLTQEKSAEIFGTTAKAIRDFLKHIGKTPEELNKIINK